MTVSGIPAVASPVASPLLTRPHLVSVAWQPEAGAGIGGIVKFGARKGRKVVDALELQD